MPVNTALRFKSGKGKSIRIDRMRAQKRKEVKGKLTRFKTVCTTILLLVGSLAFLLGFFVYRNLNQNFASASSYDNYSLEYPSFVYLVVDDFHASSITLKKLNFVILDEQSTKAFVFELPLNIPLDLPGKYTGMPLSKLFLLGGLNTENKLDGGLSLIDTTVFKIFGFDISNFIIVEEPLDGVFSNLLNGKEVFPFGGLTPLNMRESFYTSYSLKDFYQTQKFLASLPSSSITRTVLNSDQLHTPTYIDDQLSSMTMSSNISNEKKTISVLNGTSVSGVATLSSRVISNIGGRVVAIENASSEYPNTLLISDDLDSETVAYIKKSFGIERGYTKQEASFVKEDAMSRSDIIVVIGFDLADRLY